MISKRTIIGMVVGSIIIGIGAASLAIHIGTITVNESHVLVVGDSTIYTIPAPTGTEQSMQITGESFDLKLEIPGDDQPSSRTSYKDGADLNWTHLSDGPSIIQIQNTGGTDLEITGVLIRSSDPIWFTYDLMVMISGVVIIGFSMGFTMRKPKGF